jgi:1-phosphatidylinositol-4-phosphate 5-kinase
LQVRFVVMNNLLRTDVPIHRKFDLKGSTHKRTAGTNPRHDAILKDLDIDMKLHLAPEWHRR